MYYRLLTLEPWIQLRRDPSRVMPEGQTQTDPDGAVDRRHMCEQPAVSHGLDSANNNTN